MVVVRRVGLVLALILGVLALPGADALAATVSSPGTSADTAAGTASVAPGLEAKASDGDVPVVAVTRVPGEQVADAVAATLPEGSASPITAGAAKQLALTVDADGLEALAASPEIVQVVEDKPNRVTADAWASSIGLPAAQTAGWDGSGRTIAVLDTGFQVDHPYLDGKVVAEACFSRSGSGIQSLCPNGNPTEQHGAGTASFCTGMSGCEHGTHVAGIAAGGPVTTPSALAGVAPGASLILVKVFSRDTNVADCGSLAATPCLVAWDSDLAAALNWLDSLPNDTYPGLSRPDAVNLSLGSGAYTGTCDTASAPLTNAISALRLSGVATVAAAGNAGHNSAGNLAMSSPACVSTAVSVAATTGLGSIASYSNLSPLTSVLAPGSSIYSSKPNGSYGFLSGTSMATPMVTGAFALLRQRNPSVTVSTSVNTLQVTGDPVSTAAGTKPEIQLDRALAFTTPGAPEMVTAVPDDGQVIVSWSAPASNGGAPISGYSVSGTPGGSCTTTGATTCAVTGLVDGTPYTFVVTATNAAGTGPASTASSAVVPGPGRFTAVSPTRLLDTRLTSRLGQSAPLPLKVAGVTVGSTTIPADAVAVMANVTVTEPSSSSFLTVYPGGSTRPNASNLNYVAGQTVPNLVLAKVGLNGEIMLFNAFGTTQVIVDVVGYYTASGGSAFTSVTPGRFLDTRSTAPLGPLVPRSLPVAGVTVGSTVIPDDAVAVVANVTVTDPTASAFLTVYPGGSTRPLASNLNYGPGQTVPNLVVVKVGSDGAINLFNSFGSAHVIVDVVGYYGPTASSLLTSVAPTRILDTRPSSALGASVPRPLKVAGVGGVPADAVAVVANVTVTESTAASFLTVYPDGISRPLASNLNYGPGQTVPNLVVVKVGAGGNVDLFNSFGSTQVIVDVVGYYRAA